MENNNNNYDNNYSHNNTKFNLIDIIESNLILQILFIIILIFIISNFFILLHLLKNIIEKKFNLSSPSTRIKRNNRIIIELGTMTHEINNE